MRLLSSFSLLLSCAAGLASAAPTVTVNSNQVITGSGDSAVSSFKGIRFADAPLGENRFRAPVPFNGSYNGLQATQFGQTCESVNPGGVINVLNTLIKLNPFNSMLQQLLPPVQSLTNMADLSEDCLFLNVYKPATANPNTKLPVMVWFFGGAFVFGSGSTYDGARYVKASQRINQPVIVVTFNHRLGPFGYLGGSAIKAEGSGNPALLDQRLVLQWVQKNIGSFGGDPDKVTLFGESAGGMNIFAQMTMYDGDHTYNGKPLFRAAIMQSGSLLPMDTITDSRPERLFKHFSNAAGCTSSDGAQNLACLRTKSTAQLSAAMNSWSVIDGFGAMDIFITWSPRGDGVVLRDAPRKLLAQGKIAKVPFIIGDQNDEATLFSLLLSWKTWTDGQLFDVAKDLWWKSTDTTRNTLLNKYYPSDPSQGAPFGTGILYWLGLGVQFKRISALLTDLLYHVGRRQLLRANDGIKRWNYISTALSGLPYLGTPHANDLIWQWFLDIGPFKAYQDYFIAFANNLDPNVGVSLTNWPSYTNNGKETLDIGFSSSSRTTDDFRNEKIQYMIDNPEAVIM